MKINGVFCEKLLATKPKDMISNGMFAKWSAMCRYNTGSSLELGAFFMLE